MKVELCRGLTVKMANLIHPRSDPRFVCNVPCAYRLDSSNAGSVRNLAREFRKRLREIRGMITVQVFLNNLDQNASVCQVQDREDVIRRILELTNVSVQESQLQLEVSFLGQTIIFKNFQVKDFRSEVAFHSEAHVSETVKRQLKKPVGKTTLVSAWIFLPDQRGVLSASPGTLDDADVNDRVFRVPELLERILKLVIEDTNSVNIRKICSVNRTWRKATVNILKLKGQPVHDLSQESLLPLYNLMPGGFPLGCALPIGLSLRTLNTGKPGYLSLLRESVVKVTVTKLSVRLARNLSTQNFPNMSRLQLLNAGSNPSFTRTVSQVLRSCSTIKYFVLDETSASPNEEASRAASQPTIQLELPKTLKSLNISVSSLENLRMFRPQNAVFPRLENLIIYINFENRLEDHWEVVQWILNQVASTLYSLKLGYNALAANQLIRSRNTIMIPEMPHLFKVELSGAKFELNGSIGSPSGLPMLSSIAVAQLQGEQLDELFKADLGSYSKIKEIFVSNCPDFRFPFRGQRLTACLVYCTSMTIAMLPGFNPVVFPSIVFAGMPQLTQLTLEILDEYMNYEIPDSGDLEMMLTGLTAERLAEVKRNRDTWSTLTLGPTSLTNLQSLKSLKLSRCDKFPEGSYGQFTEFLFVTTVKKMQALESFKLINFQTPPHYVVQQWNIGMGEVSFEDCFPLPDWVDLDSY